MSQSQDNALKEDLTGRTRLARNVLFSWASYFVILIAGFVMPRLIDNYVGQVSLGIWDFCWSFVNYMNVMGLGVGSSVNRYVSKYRSKGDLDLLNITVSSVVSIQLISSILIFLCTLSLAYALPYFFKETLEDEIVTAQWVVLLLGSSVATQMALDTARGIVTGCHRWDIHNAIHAASHVVIAILMALSLFLGYGLIALGVIYLLSVLITEIIRVAYAFRVCEGLEVRFRLANLVTAKKMLLFGGKTVIASLPPLVIIQTTSMLIAGFIGPAALAIFARPIALMRHAQTFISKFTFILIPTAGSLQSTENTDDLKRFYLYSTRYGMGFTLPIIIMLALYGDVILYLWMGESYAIWELIAILSIGYLLPISQDSALRVMMGINLHGKIGIYTLAITIIGLIIGFLILQSVGWSLNGAALMVVIPLTIGNGIVLPILACINLNISLKQYFYNSIIIPILCVIPFIISLIGLRLYGPENHIISLIIASLLSLVIVTPVYWYFLLEKSHRERFNSIIMKKIFH